MAGSPPGEVDIDPLIGGPDRLPTGRLVAPELGQLTVLGGVAQEGLRIIGVTRRRHVQIGPLEEAGASVGVAGNDAARMVQWSVVVIA